MNTETSVKLFLQKNDFRVEKISGAGKKSPDFLVCDSTHTYLLEVKDKLPNPQKAVEREAVLNSGEMHQMLDSTGRTNTISSVVKDACEQLAAYKAQTVDFRLLWFQACGVDTELQGHQIFATIYGIKTITALRPKSPARNCFYAEYNDFYRFKDVLDAVILVEGDTAQFCVNSFSRVRLQLLESRLAQVFGQGIVDPVTEEKAGNAFLADFDCDRSNRPLFLKKLGDKYGGAQMREFQLNQFSAEVRASNPLRGKHATLPSKIGTATI